MATQYRRFKRQRERLFDDDAHAHAERPVDQIAAAGAVAAGRAVQVRHLLTALDEDTVVLGADLNLGRGRAEPAWRSLQEAGFRFGVPPRLPAWRHTYHALPRLVIDYILIRDRAGAVPAARIHRLDEDPADRGPTVFGSDHHPLLARIDLA